MTPRASLPFDGLVKLYDETRTFDARCFEAALDFLAERFPVGSHPAVFEPGIGTGRIAFPLAARGYSVTGADISREMLEALRGRLRRTPAVPPVACLLADAARLPFPDNRFDLALAVHLFYFLREWRKAAAVPERIHGEAVKTLAAEAGLRYDDPSATVEVPNQIYFILIRRS
jgi:ubiquinone/menaquinone biosynthesis C-methylase UbiE